MPGDVRDSDTVAPRRSRNSAGINGAKWHHQPALDSGTVPALDSGTVPALDSGTVPRTDLEGHRSPGTPSPHTLEFSGPT